MFTGIIESLGEITEIQTHEGDVRMRIRSVDNYLDDSALGDSIAVNGVCLTVMERGKREMSADLSIETLDLTTAGSWQRGHRVNLEKALTSSKPLGGHFVSGHVDGKGALLGRTSDARSWRLEFEAPAEIARYIARKGSITIDGVSLTVNDVEGSRFGVNIIPHTMDHTTLGGLEAGDHVNLEVDLVARYLERLLTAREAT